MTTAHGDPLPANLLLDTDTVAWVDWKHCRRYHPGWDYAVLNTVGAHASPTLAQAILDRATDHIADGVASPRRMRGV